MGKLLNLSVTQYPSPQNDDSENTYFINLLGILYN